MTGSGSALDRMFFVETIPHHAAGLPVARRATPHVENATLRTLGGDTVPGAGEREMHEIVETIPSAIGVVWTHLGR